MRRLIIIGASGHGKVVADCAVKNGYERIVFLDDDESVTHCGKYEVVGRSAEADRLPGDVIVAIGNASFRKRIQARMDEKRLITLIHPEAVVGDDVEIGAGSVVMAGVVINPGSRIGKGVIVNTCSSIDHDCKIGDFVHVAVGAHLAGSVEVGEASWIGAGAIVNNNLCICKSCMIGAGAVVVKDLEAAGIYVGVPAKRMTDEICNASKMIREIGLEG